MILEPQGEIAKKVSLIRKFGGFAVRYYRHYGEWRFIICEIDPSMEDDERWMLTGAENVLDETISMFEMDIV
jgi:hypothetical protein